MADRAQPLFRMGKGKAWSKRIGNRFRYQRLWTWGWKQKYPWWNDICRANGSASARAGVHQKRLSKYCCCLLHWKQKHSWNCIVALASRKHGKVTASPCKTNIERRYGYGKRIWKTQLQPWKHCICYEWDVWKKRRTVELYFAFALQKHSACGL